jgi:hypothetical protein
MGFFEYIRKSFAKSDVFDFRKEARYQAKRGGISMLVRSVTGFIAQAIELAAETIGQFITTFFGPLMGALGGSIAGIASMGISAGVSAAFAQSDYSHQKSNLLDLYRDELATMLKKPADQVTVRDLEMAAEKSPVIKEELDRARKQRNFSVPLAAICTLAAFAVSTCVLPFLIPAVSSLSWGWGLAAKMAVSVPTYYAVKIPAQNMGDKWFGLYKETANDAIVELKLAHEQGQAVTPEQVKAVFAKIAPKLPASAIPAEQLANDINNGKRKVTELAFIEQNLKFNREEVSVAAIPNADKAMGRQSTTFVERLALSSKDDLSYARAS